MADAAGLNIGAWDFWQWPFPARALNSAVTANITSVMNVGILAGVAASLAGRFAPMLKIPPRSIAAALIGGLLLCYGACLAFGCNIGAFFSGVVSGSLHGWVWLVFGPLGTVAGIYLRPLFGFTASGNLLPGAMREKAL